MSRNREFPFALTAAALLAMAVTACSGSPAGPSPITDPGTTPATLTAVKIEGSASLEEGDTQQLRAMAQLSDGSTRDVSAQASWRSSDATVATVSATGLVTALKTGSADVSAAYQGQTGRQTLTVGAAAWDLRFTFASFTAVETCDDFTQGLGTMEIAYKVSVVLADGRETVVADTGHPGNPSGSDLKGVRRLDAGQVVSLNQSRSFRLPGQAGQLGRVELRATEWDEQIVVFPPSVRWVRDDRMNARLGSRAHSYANGSWSSVGNNSITLGSSGCRVRLDYQVTATRS